jgi:hypothetical protein
LIPGKRPSSSSSFARNATWAALLLTAATLAGCSGVPSTSEKIPQSRPDPSYRDIIAGHLKSALPDYASYEGFEISDPRWVHSLEGWAWLTCVRFQDHSRMRTYALFIKGSVIIDARYAVQTDECDLQAYGVFERMGGFGLGPLH